MPNIPKSWKAFELKVAGWMGGQRRGADYSGFAGGKNDIILPGWSIEVKHHKRVTYQMMVNACIQAEKAKENPLDIPVAVIKRKHKPMEDTLFVMRKDAFLKHFVNGGSE